MKAHMAVRIPAAAWPSFERYLTISTPHLGSLADCLADATAMPDVEDLAESCGRAVGIDAAAVEAVLTVAINLSVLQRDLEAGAADTVQAVWRSLKQSHTETLTQEMAARWDERAPILERILVAPAIETMGKVRELIYHFQCIFQAGAVLTDVRHIYSNDASEVVGGLVVHTLALEYSESGRQCQLHLALDGKDISDLQKKLHRAQRKADTTEALLRKAGIPELTPRKNLP